MAKRKKEISEFGQCLVRTIAEAKMHKSDFYTAVGINKPYFYEILTGTAPPQDTLEKMLSVIEEKLGPSADRRHQFYDLAARSRREIPADIYDLIKAHSQEWETVRTALAALLAPQG